MKHEFESLAKLIASGHEFDARSPLIEQAHQKALQQCYQYNQQATENRGYNIKILASLLHQIGKDPYVEPNFYCQFGNNISFGDEVFLNHDCTLLDYAPIIIGNQANIAPKVGIYTASPCSELEKRKQHLMIAKPIMIKDNVWIGGNACILGGVTIGNNAIIGAGSVVTHDIPNDAIAVGNPARVIRINK